MILERCANVTRLIDDYNDQGKIEDLVERFRERDRNLVELISDLNDLVGIAESAKERQLADDLPATRVRTIDRQRMLVETALDSSIDEALRSPAIGELISELRSYTLELKTWAQLQWRQYVASTQTIADMDVLDLFEKIGMKASDVVAARRRTLIVDRLANQAMVTSEEWTTYDQAVQAINQAWDNMGAASLDPGIRKFLAGVISEGAPLGSLTPKITKWINETGAGDYLRIRPL